MIPKEKALIKYNKYLTKNERSELLEGLKFFLGESILFFDVIGIIEEIDKTIKIIEWFFVFIDVMVLVLCALSLVVIYQTII